MLFQCLSVLIFLFVFSCVQAMSVVYFQYILQCSILYPSPVWSLCFIPFPSCMYHLLKESIFAYKPYFGLIIPFWTILLYRRFLVSFPIYLVQRIDFKASIALIYSFKIVLYKRFWGSSSFFRKLSLPSVTILSIFILSLISWLPFLDIYMFPPTFRSDFQGVDFSYLAYKPHFATIYFDTFIKTLFDWLFYPYLIIQNAGATNIFSFIFIFFPRGLSLTFL